MKFAIALGIFASLMFPVSGMAADSLGAIQGSVRDAGGTPVVGALVVAMTATPSMGERMAFTDSYGAFSIPNLLLGEYSVKVTMSRFLPAIKAGIQLSSGTTAILSLNLQTAMDVFRNANAHDRKDSQDIVWILRSSRAAQPVLRLVEEARATAISSPDYSGFVQIYSRSVESSGNATDGIGSRFSLTMPLPSHSKVTLDGQYNESASQPRGFSATYDFAPLENHQSQLSVNLREGPLANGVYPGADLKEVQIKYDEKLQLLKHLIFNYSAETGRTAGVISDHYFRPGMGFSFVPDAKTTVGVAATAEAPNQADDPIRGKDYFEQHAFLPPTRETYRHAEVNASRIVDGTTKFSGGIFKDKSTSPTVFITMPDGSKSFLILDGRNTPSLGARVYVDRGFKVFDAGVGYTVATGLGLLKPASSTAEVRDQMGQRQFHVFTARIKTDVDLTNTELIAVYRWVSPLAAMSIDPYQSSVEYNDPTLSITVAQTLPTWGTFPGKVQAILDARNLFEQSNFNRGAQISNSPRFVKGGINIRF